MTVANTGSSASMSENVARGSRAMASWSATYGMTDEQTPIPAPASSRTGCRNAGRAPPRPQGAAAIAATHMAAESLSTPLGPLPSTPATAIRWPRTMYAMNSAQLAKAKANPSGCPVRRIAVMVATPAVVSPRAPALRTVRAPAAARITVPRNSIALTVDRGSRSTAR